MLRSITSTLVLTAIAASAVADCPSGCIAPPPNMVAWWMLDEASPSVANDSALANHGAHTNGPSIVSGVLNNALDFDGVNDFVTVPSHASLNFGPALGPGMGDFTIDAWIRVDQIRAEHDPIVEKRDGNRGYYFYVWDSFLGLSMADASGHVDYCCVGPITIGADTHVAVTVDRDDPNGVVFYINGAVAGTFNPTAQTGSLANSADLFLGRNRYQSLPGSPVTEYDGMIDEVEIFDRSLSAAEINGIFGSCKCRHKCRVPRTVGLCQSDQSKTINVMVCNHGVTPRDFNVAVNGVDDCMIGGCSIPGPTAADITILTALPVTVPPGGCVPVAVQINRPSGMVAAGDTACYMTTITAVDNGQETHCCGSLVDRRNWCPVNTSNGGFFPVRPSAPDDLVIQIHNNTGDFSQLPYEVAIIPRGGGSGGAISLNGLPPGEPVRREVGLEPLSVGEIPLVIELVDFEAFSSYDLVLHFDTDGDGVVETPIASMIVQGELAPPCPADLDGDGTIGFTDLVALLAAWGSCAGCSADLDGDGLVGFPDLIALLSSWGGCS